MKKIFTKWLAVFLLLTIVAFVFAGCGSDSAGVANYDAEADSLNTIDGIISEGASKGKITTSESSKQENNSKDGDVSTNRKIIEKLSYTVETKEFDKFVDDINKKIKEIGGYIEESQFSGNSYSSYDKKNAYMIIRVPTGKKDNFTEFISVNGNVVSKNSSSEDVTLKYVDIESRINALTAEKESLEGILKRADKVADVLTVKEKLTDVIYEIESYKSQLKTYDSLIEFTTIRLTIQDVDEVTNTQKLGFFSQIKETFVNSIHGVGSVVKALAIILIGGSPYIVLILIFVAIAFFIIKKINKKTTKKVLKQLPSIYEKQNQGDNQNNAGKDKK